MGLECSRQNWREQLINAGFQLAHASRLITRDVSPSALSLHYFFSYLLTQHGSARYLKVGEKNIQFCSARL